MIATISQSTRAHVVFTSIGVVHIITAILLLGSHDAKTTTPLSLLSWLCGGNINILALVLFVVGYAAIIPAMFRISGAWNIVLLMPQQVVISFHLLAIVLAVANGAYPDGYVPKGGATFIAVDQIWLALVAVSHSYEYFYSLSRVK